MTTTQMSALPFDLVLCEQEPDGAMVICLTPQTQRVIGALFPAIKWSRHDGQEVAFIVRQYAAKVACEALKVNLRVAFAEYMNGALTVLTTKLRRVDEPNPDQDARRWHEGDDDALDQLVVADVAPEFVARLRKALDAMRNV